MSKKIENAAYLNKQIITYPENKRKLLSFINEGISIVKLRSGRQKLSFYDVFSGFGIVARYFKQYASKILVNDMKRYSEIINSCYLSNKSEIGQKNFCMYKYVPGQQESSTARYSY